MIQIIKKLERATFQMYFNSLITIEDAIFVCVKYALCFHRMITSTNVISNINFLVKSNKSQRRHYSRHIWLHNFHSFHSGSRAIHTKSENDTIFPSLWLELYMKRGGSNGWMWLGKCKCDTIHVSACGVEPHTFFSIFHKKNIHARARGQCEKWTGI